MKTIPEISKESGLAKSTLRSRVKRLGIEYIKEKGFNLVKNSDIQSLIFESERKPSNLTNKFNPKLIFAFKEENPFLNNEEISICLCVPKHIVDESIKGSYFIFKSKIN